MTQFSDLGLEPALLKALAAEGYQSPTPIQQKAVPHVLEGRDLIGLAQTGTGKTAAFALPVLQRLSKANRKAEPRTARALVLAPTRELAAQIAESFRAYGRFMQVSVGVVFGGVSIGRQISLLNRGLDVLVATPGRLLDLVDQRACRLDAVEILVLDEADHMMDLGFIHALKRIASLLPRERQTLFFSATMPAEIAELGARFVRDPVQVSVAPVAATAERVRQSVLHVETAKKGELLVDLMRDGGVTRALVFTRTKHGADKVVRRLEHEGLYAVAIHGNKSQAQRERALEAFRKGLARLLVATDIAARGIDVDGVSHVVNFDLPNVPEAYVHRIGRTARAGAEGVAISFCAPDERGCLRDIEKLTRQSVPVMTHTLATAGSLPSQAPAPRQQQQGRGGRPHQGRGNGQGRGQKHPQQRRGGGGHGHGHGQGRPQGGKRQGRPGS